MRTIYAGASAGLLMCRFRYVSMFLLFVFKGLCAGNVCVIPRFPRLRQDQARSALYHHSIILRCSMMDEATEHRQDRDETLRSVATDDYHPVFGLQPCLPATPACLGAANTVTAAASEDDPRDVDTDVRTLLAVKKTLRELLEGCGEPDQLRSVVLQCCKKKKLLRTLRKKYDVETLVASIRRVVHGDQFSPKSEACTQDPELSLGCTGLDGASGAMVETPGTDVEGDADGTLNNPWADLLSPDLFSSREE